MAHLIWTSGGTEHRTDLGLGVSVKVGRDPSNEIALPHEQGASRRHCMVTGLPAPGGGVRYELTDLGATNRTRVNGEKVERRNLAHGDMVQVGSVSLRFEDPAEAAALAAAGAEHICLLEWLSGERKGEKVWLRSPRTTIGRRDSNTIPLRDRMASGHHAEITRDLNGYTLKDLGSTNGTLVNGDPVSEVVLNHGAHIRIGNSQFAFKDPSMKDIEVELSRVEEDAGWGMMGEIDLSRARRSPAGLAIGLLVLLVAAGGVWLFVRESARRETADAGPAVGLMVDGDFESGHAESLWALSGPPREDVTSAVKAGRGGHVLEVRTAPSPEGEAPAAPALVLYGEALPVFAERPLRLRARIERRDRAELVVVWRTSLPEDLGLLSQSIPVGAPGDSTVDVVLQRPSWADQCRLGLLVSPGASAILDDVSLGEVTKDVAGAPALDPPGDAEASVSPVSGGLDLMVHRVFVLAGNARPVAIDTAGVLKRRFTPQAVTATGATEIDVEGVLASSPADDAPLEARVHWSLTKEGLEASVSVPGSKSAGLLLEIPHRHLGGGIDALTAAGPRTLAAQADQSVGDAWKVLAGSPDAQGALPATLVSLEASEGASGVLRVEDAPDATLLSLAWLFEGEKASVRFLTDYRLESEEARQRLAEATAFLRESPGAGIARLKSLAQEYPFLAPVRDAALERAAAAEGAALADIAALEAALSEFRIFETEASLERARSLAAGLSKSFPVTGEESSAGPIERRVAELGQEVVQAFEEWQRRGAGRVLGRLERLGDMLRGVPGYESMAALYYRSILQRFGHLAGDSILGERIDRARTHLEQLVAEAGEAIPPSPQPPAAPKSSDGETPKEGEPQ